MLVNILSELLTKSVLNTKAQFRACFFLIPLGHGKDGRNRNSSYLFMASLHFHWSLMGKKPETIYPLFPFHSTLYPVVDKCGAEHGDQFVCVWIQGEEAILFLPEMKTAGKKSCFFSILFLATCYPFTGHGIKVYLTSKGVRAQDYY